MDSPGFALTHQYGTPFGGLSPAVAEEARPCPSCGEPAEPEQDGQVTYFSCPECGHEFGYSNSAQEGLCAAGLPVEVRYDAVQPPGVMSLEPGGDRRSVFLGAEIKRRSE